MGIFKKILLSFSAFVLLIVFGALSLFLLKDKPKKDFTKSDFVRIGGQEFIVEIAANAFSQARGLSGRDSLPENQGMLFIFKELGARSFWMAGMKFPLDIIWIKGDRVVGISENLPPASGFDVELYNPPEPVDKVLEINAGLADRFGIKIGAGLTFYSK